MRVVLVGDEGPGRGLGHRRRLQAIARALGGIGVATEVRAGGEAPVSAPIVVVDSYDTRADDHHLYRGDLVVALDDLDRDLAVDLVVEPSPGATAELHRAAGRVLAGAAYALVEPAPPGLETKPIGPTADTVLVATGAADMLGEGGAIATSLRAAAPELVVRLVVGQWGCRQVPNGVEIVETVSGLLPELAAADVVITAGGVTLLEALHLGRPAVAVELHGNQHRNVEGVLGVGAAVVAAPAAAARVALALGADPEQRARLSAAGSALVDGRGPGRVAAAIASVAGERGVRVA